VQGGGGVLLGEVGEQPLVHLFHKVVAALVEAVDGAFDAGDPGVGGWGSRALFLFVPQIEVLAVPGAAGGEKKPGFFSRGGIFWGFFRPQNPLLRRARFVPGER